MLNNNKITLEEARNHPHRAVIVQAIGLQTQHDLQVGQNTGFLTAGQKLLLCSDGLNDAIESSKIAAILAQENDLATACDRLVAEAVAAGGRDNVTVVLAMGADLDLPGSGASSPGASGSAMADPVSNSKAQRPHIYWSFDPVTQRHIRTEGDSLMAAEADSSQEPQTLRDFAAGTQIIKAQDVKAMGLPDATTMKTPRRLRTGWLVLLAVLLIGGVAGLVAMIAK